MNATSLFRVKDLLKIPQATVTEDPILNRLVEGYSARFERYLGRHLEQKARTEYYDVEKGQQRVWLKGFPVASVTSIANDYDRAFGSGTTIASTDYVFYKNTGEVNFYQYALTPGPQVLKVVYTGGMAVDTGKLIAAFPDVALAADLQVAFAYQRRSQVGLSSVSVAGGGTASFEREDWQEFIPEVHDLLGQYRRMGMGLGTVGEE